MIEVTKEAKVQFKTRDRGQERQWDCEKERRGRRHDFSISSFWQQSLIKKLLKRKLLRKQWGSAGFFFYPVSNYGTIDVSICSQ